MEAHPMAAAGWCRLSWDLTELILSYLPLRSLVHASAVCRQWRSVITDPTFPSRASGGGGASGKPWFFLYGLHNLDLRKNQAFAFDPDSNEWSLLPNSPLHDDCFTGAGGFSFATTSSTRFSFAPLLRRGPWRETSPLSFPRCNPLVGVIPAPRPRFIVVGGARFIGGLVDIEDRLAVEIYDPEIDGWELCPPLPPNFRLGNSSQWLSSALLHGRFFFVFGIYTGVVSAFDLDRRAWTGVQILRPPGVLFAFLLACRDRLVLAGLCNTPDGLPCFALWSIDHRTMESSEIAVMPPDLLYCLFGSDDDDAKFASLKCVGLDGLIYVFNEDHHKAYPACVCEITGSGGGGGAAPRCSWRKVPALPWPVKRFHKVIAFCSEVPLHSVLLGGAEG